MYCKENKNMQGPQCGVFNQRGGGALVGSWIKGLKAETIGVARNAGCGQRWL